MADAWRYGDRYAAMMAEIEAKQRELERLVAEEAKKNIIPTLIEVLEEEIEDSIETQRIKAVCTAADLAKVHHPNAPPNDAALTFRLTFPAAQAAAARARDEIKMFNSTRQPEMRVRAEYLEAFADQCRHMDEMSSKAASCRLLRAQLDAAKKDAEWKIQSFKIIDALTQRVAALEARLDAKETVPIGLPVLGSAPESDEDSCEGSEEPARRKLFPYW